MKFSLVLICLAASIANALPRNLHVRDNALKTRTVSSSAVTADGNGNVRFTLVDGTTLVLGLAGSGSVDGTDVSGSGGVGVSTSRKERRDDSDGSSEDTGVSATGSADGSVTTDGEDGGVMANGEGSGGLNLNLDSLDLEGLNLSLDDILDLLGLDSL